MKIFETNLGAATAKFDAGLVSLVLMQQQDQALGILGNGDVGYGFPRGSRCGGWSHLMVHVI